MLHAFGVGPHDRVAIAMPDGPEAATAFLSVACAAVAAPMNPTYQTEEFALYLEDLRARAILVPAGEIALPIAEAAARRGCAIIQVKRRGDLAGAFELCGDRGSATPAVSREPTADALALVLHTSGTASRPKLVPLTHANLCASARNIARSLDLDSSDRCLSLMPHFHVGGLVRTIFAPLSAGGSVICPPGGFRVSPFIQWLDEYKPTWYTAVPTMQLAIVEQLRQRAPLPIRSTLRFIRSGAAELPAETAVDLERIFGAPVIQGYGMTEAASQVASNPLPPRVRKPGSIGLPAGPEMAIIDEHGCPLGPEQIGEVVLRGPNMMAGYESNPDANAEAFINGWFRTGDLAYRDREGYFFLTGRVKEIINRGGEKISPREVEDVLLGHPSVERAVVFSVPDATLGESVAAAVVLRHGAISARALREFVASRLAFFKVPQRIVFVDEIPVSATGKVQRTRLAETLRPSIDACAPDDWAPERGRPVVAPDERIEALVLEAAAVALGRPTVDARCSFLDSGGDSLHLVQFVARLRQRFGVPVAILDVFDAPSLSAVAGIITARVLEEL